MNNPNRTHTTNVKLAVLISEIDNAIAKANTGLKQTKQDSFLFRAYTAELNVLARYSGDVEFIESEADLLDYLRESGNYTISIIHSIVADGNDTTQVMAELECHKVLQKVRAIAFGNS